jgi:hypothetical protein
MALDPINHLENCLEKPAAGRVKKVRRSLPWPEPATQEDLDRMRRESFLGMICFGPLPLEG